MGTIEQKPSGIGNSEITRWQILSTKSLGEMPISTEIRLPTPKVLMFDLGRVFLDARYRTLYQTALDNFGLPAEKTGLVFGLNEYYEFTRGRIDGHELCDALRRELGMQNVTDEQIREAHDSHIVGVVPGMLKILGKVSKKVGNDNIVFVTDACEWQVARQQQLLDLSNYRVFASNEVGMLKTDPEVVSSQGHRRSFFLYVLEKFNLQPEEALLIDDSPEKIAVARAYGIQTIQFENKDQLEAALRERQVLD